MCIRLPVISRLTRLNDSNTEFRMLGTEHKKMPDDESTPEKRTEKIFRQMDKERVKKLPSNFKNVCLINLLIVFIV